MCLTNIVYRHSTSVFVRCLQVLAMTKYLNGEIHTRWRQVMVCEGRNFYRAAEPMDDFLLVRRFTLVNCFTGGGNYADLHKPGTMLQVKTSVPMSIDGQICDKNKQCSFNYKCFHFKLHIYSTLSIIYWKTIKNFLNDCVKSFC